MTAGFLLVLFAVVGLPTAASARVPVDSLLIIASEADEQRTTRAISELSRRAEALQRRAFESRVNRMLQDRVPDTLLLTPTVPIADLAAYRADAVEAIRSMHGLAREARIGARFLAEGTRRPPPVTAAPAIVGTGPPVAGVAARERLRQATDLVHPFLLGSGMVVRSYSETASNILVVGGVASAVIGYFTAPERATRHELLQWRAVAPPDDTVEARRLTDFRPGRPAVSLADQAGVDFEARRLMLDEYHRRAARILASFTQIEGELQDLARAWERGDEELSNLAVRTSDAAAGLMLILEQTENMGTAAYGFSREISFIADAFQKADPQTEEHFRIIRNRSRMFTSAYDDEVDPQIISHLGRARVALARLQSAALAIN